MTIKKYKLKVPSKSLANRQIFGLASIRSWNTSSSTTVSDSSKNCNSTGGGMLNLFRTEKNTTDYFTQSTTHKQA